MDFVQNNINIFTGCRVAADPVLAPLHRIGFYTSFLTTLVEERKSRLSETKKKFPSWPTQELGLAAGGRGKKQASDVHTMNSLKMS